MSVLHLQLKVSGEICAVDFGYRVSAALSGRGCGEETIKRGMKKKKKKKMVSPSFDLQELTRLKLIL